MKALNARYTVLAVLAIFALVFLPACALGSSAGTMSLASVADTSVSEEEEVEVSLKDVAEGMTIRLIYPLNEVVRIEILGTNQIVTIDRGRWTPYTDQTIVWVRANGDRMHLVEAIRSSISEPIVGTVHIAEEDGIKIFEVYKDASLIP